MFQNYENINDRSTPTSSQYDKNLSKTVKIINAPNNIPSLQLQLEINKNKGYLTISDIINIVVTRYRSLGLNNNFPSTNITVLLDNKPYNHTANNTQVPDNGRLSKIEILLPKEIEKKYLMTKEEANERSSLTDKPNSSWWPWS